MRFRFQRLAELTAAGAIAVAVALGTPSAVPAQQHGGHYHGEDGRRRDDHDYRRARVQLGGGLGVSVPQGDFGLFTEEGFGGNLYAAFPVDRSGAVAIRLDGGYVNYGSERFSVPFFPPTGRVGIDVRTRNNIATFGIGPQIQVPRGRLRPFINGFVGVGYFFTESSLSDGPSSFGSTVNFDDWALGYGFGGGLGLEVSRSVTLNFEAQYRMHDDVEYLREGGIVDDGFGGVIVNPILSDADYLLFQIGVSIGL